MELNSNPPAFLLTNNLTARIDKKYPLSISTNTISFFKKGDKVLKQEIFFVEVICSDESKIVVPIREKEKFKFPKKEYHFQKECYGNTNFYYRIVKN